jgi:hypothetical protein
MRDSRAHSVRRSLAICEVIVIPPEGTAISIELGGGRRKER